MAKGVEENNEILRFAIVYVSCIQMLLVVSQSVVLGYLTDYFSIQGPTTEDTRNAYLYALGIAIITSVILL